MSRGEKVVYTHEVQVIRKDGELYSVFESKSFEEAKKVWEQLDASWTTSVKETIPFKLFTKYLITSFDPGLILEIKLVSVEIESNRAYSAYNQNMSASQFAAQFGKSKESVEGTGDVIDGGYK